MSGVAPNRQAQAARFVVGVVGGRGRKFGPAINGACFIGKWMASSLMGVLDSKSGARPDEAIAQEFGIRGVQRYRGVAGGAVDAATVAVPTVGARRKSVAG